MTREEAYWAGLRPEEDDVPTKDDQIATLTAERDALLAREKAYLSELADYGRMVKRLREQVAGLRENVTRLRETLKEYHEWHGPACSRHDLDQYGPEQPVTCEQCIIDWNVREELEARDE